jgi:transposase InsO family protein
MPRLRRDVAQYVRYYGVRKASRHFGILPGTISKWWKKAQKLGSVPIPTRSSKPKHHPKQLQDDVVRKILDIRLKTNRTSEVVHQALLNQGIKVSLNSVRRTIDRHGLMKKRSPWKRFHPHVDRPKALKAGDLVQIDTIHIMTGKKTRIYVFVLLDVFSRWVYARSYEKMNSIVSVEFVKEAQREAGFHFNMLQSDHGPEFGKWFVSNIKKNHRYTRIGKPNDNAHIERFNRTIQEECLDKYPAIVFILNQKIPEYLRYYNTERLHLGISLKTPIQLVNCFQGIG